MEDIKIHKQGKQPIIIVPAAGTGSRLNFGKPKLCLSFYEKPLWAQQVKCFKDELPESPVYYVVGFGHQYLEGLENHARLVLNEHYRQSNVGYSVSLGIEESGDKDVLVVYGDLYFENKFIRNIAGSGSNNFVVRDTRRLISSSSVGVVDQETNLKKFSYLSEDKWSQVLFLKNDAKWEFYDIAQKHPNLFTFEVVNRLLKRNFSFDIIDGPPNSYYTEIDTNKDFVQARKVVNHQEALRTWDCY